MPSRRVLTLLAVGALLLAGVVVKGHVLSPPRDPPAYLGERPTPEPAAAYVSHTASVVVPVPPDVFTAWVDAPGRNLSDIVRPVEGLSPIVATDALRGDWDPAGDRTGDRRRVAFQDGHFLAEEVLVDTPERFRYVIWGFTAGQRFAVSHGLAQFEYVERDGGTVVTWTYSFRPTSGLVRPFVADFVARTIAPMMRQTLDGMSAGARRDLLGAG